MSSINPEQALRYAALFDKLTAAAAESNVEYFAGGADAGVPTYYTRRAPDPASYIIEFDGAHLADALCAEWVDRPELLKLVPEIVALYEASAGDEGEEGGEVSPFIYEMF